IPPKDTPRDEFLKLVMAKETDRLLHGWTQVPQKVLNGKSPAQAAEDPALRLALSACVLLLDQAPGQLPERTAALRAHLGLPQPAPITLPPEGASEVPLLRLARVSLDGLSNEELDDIWQRMTTFHVSAGAEEVAMKLIEQGPAEDTEFVEEIY